MAHAATATSHHTPPVMGRAVLSPLARLVLMRVACAGGATRAEIARDLRAMAGGQAQAAAWRAQTDREAGDLMALGLAVEVRARLRPTVAGEAYTTDVVGAPFAQTTTWLELRDGPLTAMALRLQPDDRSILKALANPDALRALIVQSAYGLGDGKPMSLSKLRAQLAVRALERAFGNQIKSGIGSGSGLASKPSRVLAGQLSRTPRDYGSDGRLIAALAAEHLNTATGEAEALRIALLTRHFDVLIGEHQRPAAAVPVKAMPVQPVANDIGRAAERPLPSARPDLPGFIREVRKAALKRADGWPGNRKAFISHVWQEIKAAHPAWALSEIEFKGMLAEAHRTGGLVLANADLKDKKHMQEFELSAIQYKNTVWHFVRVEEA